MGRNICLDIFGIMEVAGSFTSQYSFPTGAEPYDLSVNDFNSDGWLDVLVTAEGAGNAAIYYTESLGILEASIDYTSPETTATLALTPQPDQSGTTIVRVIVKDSGLDGDLATTADNATFSRTFDVTVLSLIHI